MNPDARTRELLEMLAAERTRGRSAHLEAARRQAAELLGEAHAAARRAVREAFAVEQERRSERLAAARARLQTAERQHRRLRANALLARAWQDLPEALQQRWRQAASRAAWTQRLVARASALLPAGGWRIAHPADWPAVERQALAASLPFAVAFEADPGIAAGLRIRRDGSIVDGTLGALLADRAEVGAHLLSRLGSLGGEAS